MRKIGFLFSVLMILFCGGGVVFAQHSAMFRIIATVPPSAQAGKEIVFAVEITNTGTESWVSGEYSLFIKIYDANKNYLTETDKIRQFKDIEPGEMLTANISFDIPVDYSGTYHYAVGIEFEKETLFSHYFILKILPFAPVPEVKRWTGNVQIGYQDSQAVEPTTSLNLWTVNLLPEGRYLKFSTSGQGTPATAELSNFLIFYHAKNLDISAGDFATGLSRLTLSHSRGLRIQRRLGRISLVGLTGSSQKTSKQDLYGLRGSINLTDNFELAANYVERNKDQNSVASLQGELAISPEVTFSGEYASSSYKQGEIESEHEKRNAFQLSTSLYYEKLTLDASYEKVGRDFYFAGNSNTSGDCEQYDLSLTHSLTDYINGTIYYNKYRSGLSQNSDRLTTSTAGADLTAAFPELPLLLLTYSLDKTYNIENGNLLINDTLDDLTIGFSYPIGKTKVSANYLKFSYKDTSEPAIHETTISTNYGLSVPWGKRTTLSANYVVSSTEDLTNASRTHSRSITLGARYSLTLGKLVLSPQYKVALANSGQKNKTLTSLGLSYSFTPKSIFRLNYHLTNYGELVNPDKAISDKFSINLSYQHSLTKNHKLELNYNLASQRNLTALDSPTTTRDSTLRLIYSYHF